MKHYNSTKTNLNKKVEILYFAYGTLTNYNWMKRLCPSSIYICAAKLFGYKKQGLNVLQSDNNITQGILWELTNEGKEQLDKYEGYLNLYTTKQVIIELDNLEKTLVNAFIYVLR